MATELKFVDRLRFISFLSVILMRILNHTMSRNISLILIGLSLVLNGAFCETPDKADARSEGNGRTGNVPSAMSTPSSLRAGEESTGEQQIKALAIAYQDRIAEVAFRRDDWAVRVDDTWYYWAHGRLLPEELRQRWEEYASYRFYSYSLELPPIPNLDEESKRRLEDRLEQAAVTPPKRHEGFLSNLYQARTRAQTEARILTVHLMGFEVRVHEQIAEPLKTVNKNLEILSEIDPGVKRFIEELNELAGYNWREIAGTQSRSYHSYGIAIDLVPKSFGGRHTYWRWALQQTDEWYAIAYEQRWMVPLQIVNIFEQEGFLWGGKWFFFDTMHFEYRPEILILAAE